jgi:hypothetical protein
LLEIHVTNAHAARCRNLVEEVAKGDRHFDVEAEGEPGCLAVGVVAEAMRGAVLALDRPVIAAVLALIAQMKVKYKRPDA